MLTRIRQCIDRLTAAERRVADWVLENPHRSVSAALASVARSARVSEPTVVRFCRSVGCRGFREFKVRLAEGLAADHHPVHRGVRAGDDEAEIIVNVIGAGVEALNRAMRGLRADRVAQAAAQIATAKRLDFFGVGSSGVVAQDACHKFFRLGIPCFATCDPPTMLQLTALARDQVVIAISKSGESQPVVEACRRARNLGSTVIALTQARSALARIASTELLIDVDEDTGLYTPMSSRLAQLAVLDVLQVAVAVRLGEAASRNLRLTKAALARG